MKEILVELKQPPIVEMIFPVGIGSGSDKTFIQQFVNESTLVVEHHLDKYPAVQIIDSAGDQIEATIKHIDSDSLVASFSSPFSGSIFCN